MKNITTPATTVERLPLYYRYLQKMDSQGVEVISSKELGDGLGIPSTQVRKDLSYYGEFGRRGVGYEVSDLMKNLERILGLDNNWEVVLVGAGNLGQALVNYGGFKKLGLDISYVLDIDPDKVKSNLGNAQVYSMKELRRVVTDNDIRIGIIAVPSEVAQQVADELIDGGIKAIWNFAPIHLRVSEDIKVRDEDLSIGLISLSYYLSN
ncbi:redox-sensing transcriptional repressor [Orenia metallireducens]|uniref:Redox-sensing transcriptional repressor Rex n=1 Tax=Orenia metallireducens TaxID=1413210 RepID=A0A285G0M7_9FIRM|nr:redox-sensing transcriptional repressor Rex [Orenia metallireducens]PRX31756.1 redox-sensing transcriptional repressor [Orenia metallireducens]SNY17089.1 redox-sensing transcriptional repressor [Orenia metallireducens]